MARTAVVGAGPAGIYTAEALLKLGHRVDVLDRLSCPYGLLRYGVAPDHLKMKALEKTLRRILDRDGVRFFGEVTLGETITVDELRGHYDAIVYATGAADDRSLSIPGEDLPGSLSATRFVSWYSGHPDIASRDVALDAHTAVVVGAGNVALDVTRLLTKSAEQFHGTDMPDRVLDTLRASPITDVHLIARRGPAQAKFTTKELRELGELGNADVLVDPADLELDEHSEQLAEQDGGVRRNLDVLHEWAQRSPLDRERRIHLRFWRSPVRITGADRVEGVELGRNTPDGAGGIRAGGETEMLAAGLVLRSIGYRGRPLPGVPFDERTGTIPHCEGRVLRAGRVAPAEYTVGWAKRGPSGVIGTNKADARETVAALAEDWEHQTGRNRGDRPDLADTLAGRGHAAITWQGWLAIEAAERELGRRLGRGAVKITDPDQLRAVVRMVLR
ncbi:FAD-dependent oxidoreductase [Sciscionella marina]|uniref:FAD-dependent oxidoreductase n=1 Tax=Sciscionella marina TaxID=508770 RepID=UPI0003689E6B|nr:FAD-dependent oxidoreductase [Sciscionella marina]